MIAPSATPGQARGESSFDIAKSAPYSACIAERKSRPRSDITGRVRPSRGRSYKTPRTGAARAPSLSSRGAYTFEPPEPML